MTMLKRAVCGAMTACMLLAVGCSGEDRTWAYQLGEEKIPVGVYIYQQIDAATSAQETLQEANADNTAFTMPETYEGLLEQQIDGQPAAGYIQAQAEESMLEYAAVESEFAARGLSVSEEEMDYLATLAPNAYAQNAELYETNGIAESSVLKLLENDLKRQTLFTSIYGEGGEKAVSEATLQQSFVENYAKANMMVYTLPAEGDAESEERKFAEDFLARLQAGEEFYTIANDLKRQEHEQSQAESDGAVEAFIEIEEGSMAYMFMDSDREMYGDALVDGIFGARAGEPVLVEDGLYLYVIDRIDLATSGDFDTYREQVLFEMKDEEFSAWLGEVGAGLELQPNEAALSHHTPERLELDA